MTTPDRWARLTPYEIGIPGRGFAEGTFAAIREEGAGRGVDLSDPAAFLQLGEVGLAIRAIQGGERGGAEIERFAAFLFHAYHFHRAGERLFLLTEPAARVMVESQGGSWGGELPAAAGYLQLPRHLFWSHPDPGSPAEPIDGLFWTETTGDTLALLVALGVRDDREGISVMELPPLPLSAAAAWIAGGSRSEGADFATTLPGGELGGLFSIVTLGEVLTLLGRTFAHLAQHPEVLGEEERAPRPAAEPSSHGGARPTHLPFRCIARGGAG